MAFHYFFPEVKLVDGQLPKGVIENSPFAVSLNDLNSGDYTAFERSIDNIPGVLLTPNVDGAPAAEVLFKPDKQTFVDVDGHMIGWETDNPPSPAELRRTNVYGGMYLDDCSDRQWIIPIARGKTIDRTTLPKDFVFNADGSADEVLSDDFAALWECSGLIYDHWNSEDDDVDLPPAQMAKFALQALSVNYRVGPAEANAFASMGQKIFDSVKVSSVCLILIDLQMDTELKKKLKSQAEEESNSISGEPEETPDTAPAE